MFNVSDSTRIGVAHRSAIRHELTGDSDIMTVGPGATVFAAGADIVDSDIEVDLTFPATTSISVHHQVNSKWPVMGNATQTRWGRLQELRIKFDSGQADSVITLDLDDVWRYSVGATYMRDSRLSIGSALFLTSRPPRTPKRQRCACPTRIVLG
ncbi:MAG: hypothetical protein E2O37_05225 [Proteobacteria bacterium]|nr:MAG: hypothetical protein E2O37_05225 [Pseudomonadota bacterium]